MATVTSPLWMTEKELKMGLSVMGGSAKPGVKIHAIMLGFGCAVDEEGQLVVSRVLQESPAAYSGQVGIGDVIEAIDGRMVTSLEQLVVAADGPEETLAALEIRRKGDSHSESLHLMRQMPRDPSDSGPNDGERAGLGARVVQDVRGMRVCDLYEGSSSYWSALKIDDIVCAVDGQDIRNGPPSLVLQLTNGSIGTSMCLQVIRKESADEDIAGALTARGLGGRDSSRINWNDSKAPVCSSNEKLIRVHVVRSRPLADRALTRALEYRGCAVDLLQKRIERALLEGNSTARSNHVESEERGKDEQRKETSALNIYKENIFRIYGREPGNISSLSPRGQATGPVLSNGVVNQGTKLSPSNARGYVDEAKGNEFSALTNRNLSTSSTASPTATATDKREARDKPDSSLAKTPRTSKFEAQVVSLQDKHRQEMEKLQENHEQSMLKLQEQISVLAENYERKSDKAHARELETLLACVETMRIQQQEEKANTVSLFQRHCQETMASQERIAGELYSEIQELRKRDSETLELKRTFSSLAEQVEILNANNVLLRNIPGESQQSLIKSHKGLPGQTASDNHHTASRNPVPKLPLSNSWGKDSENLRRNLQDTAENLRRSLQSSKRALDERDREKPNVAPESVWPVSRMQHAKPSTSSPTVQYAIRSDEPVGVSITIGADFDRVKKHEKRFSDDLVSACAWCLQTSQDRFIYCQIERGSVIAKLNIVPDPSGVDLRPCRRLAEELAAQVAHPHSPVRKAPVTKPATKVDIHPPIALGSQRSAHTMPQLQPLHELHADHFLDNSKEEFDFEPKEDSPRVNQEDLSVLSEGVDVTKKRLLKQLAEMNAVVSTLAESLPADASSMFVLSDPESPGASDNEEPDQTWTLRIEKNHPSKVPLKSVMDLSLERAESAHDQSKHSMLQHKERYSSPPRGSHSPPRDYRSLPSTSRTSALELESVLSRLEQKSTPLSSASAQTKVNRDLSRNDSSRNTSPFVQKSPSLTTFTPPSTTSNQHILSNLDVHEKGLGFYNQHNIHEKGTLTPGSDASFNMSRPFSPADQPKKWRVLPQWSENDLDQSAVDNNRKSTPRSQVDSSTPRSHRAGKEPQSLMGNLKLPLKLPEPHETEKPAEPSRRVSSGRGPSTMPSQRGNSPNLRRRQYARSDSSSEDDAGPVSSKVKARSPPPSSLGSNIKGSPSPSLQEGEKKKLKAILGDSDSDEEIRLRANDLPVRRLVNHRFQK